MTDQVKDRDNKDAEESGRPVQLDREEQGGKPGQQQGGQHEPQQDREPGQQPSPHPGQQPAQHR
jgi:hypothetical protein